MSKIRSRFVELSDAFVFSGDIQSPTPTTNPQVANKLYVDGVINSISTLESEELTYTNTTNKIIVLSNPVSSFNDVSVFVIGGTTMDVDTDYTIRFQGTTAYICLDSTSTPPTGVFNGGAGSNPSPGIASAMVVTDLVRVIYSTGGSGGGQLSSGFQGPVGPSGGPAGVQGTNGVQGFQGSNSPQGLFGTIITQTTDANAGGYDSQANGFQSLAVGFETRAYGERSIAFCRSTIASGADSFAEGRSTLANGDDSHAEGHDTQANGFRSHAEGYLSVAGFTGDSYTSSGAVLTISGNVTHRYSSSNGLRIYPAGDVPISRTSVSVVLAGGNTQITLDSAIPGASGLVYGNSLGGEAHAEGRGSASGFTSHAENTANATGEKSHAENESTAHGLSSHSEGKNTLALGLYSHAQGNASIAGAEQSFSAGNGSQANGINSIATGENSSAGFRGRPFTLSGSTITIAGVDCREEFISGSDLILYNMTPVPPNNGTDSPYVHITYINSTPAFSTNTTFNLGDTPANVTSGSIVNVVHGKNSAAFGSYAVADKPAQIAQAGSRFSKDGDSQTSNYIVSNITSNATVAELFIYGTGGVGRITVRRNQIMGFTAFVLGTKTDGTSVVYIKLEGVVKNLAGTVTISTVTKTTLVNDSSYDANAVADDTNDALRITTTGLAATNMRWVARVATNEICF